MKHLKKNSAKIFSDTAIAARFWFVIACLLFVFCCLEPIILKCIEVMKTNDKIVILDDTSNIIIARGESLFSNKKLLEETALQVTQCLLTLNNEGLEQNEFVEKLFNEKIIGDVKGTVDKIFEKVKGCLNFSQVAHVYQIKSRSNKEDILVRVEGQVVRSGAFADGQAFYLEENFTLRMQLIKNTDMLSGKRWPLIVKSFSIQWEKHE